MRALVPRKQRAGLKGSLVVVGTGIKSISHITLEAASYIRDAQKLLYLTADFLTDQWLAKENRTAESIHRFYKDNKPREQTYIEMRDYMLSFVRKGLSTCTAFYGHPGVFAAPGRMAIDQARAEGYDAFMLPGISAEDCLFADLCLDPAQTGCQSFEATDFLLYKRKFDPRCALILWQVGVIGHFDYQGSGYDASRIGLLADRLLRFYPAAHEVILYEPATHVLFHPRIERLRLENLKRAHLTTITTLYVPSVGRGSAEADMIAKLRVSRQFIKKVRRNPSQRPTS